LPDFREAHHLPKVRGDQGADPYDLPRQRCGTTPQMHGRYPDYDVLAQQEHWDEATRRVVLKRLEEPRRLRFFDEDEARALVVLSDIVLHQDSDPRIAVIAMIDEKLAAGRLEGYRFADLPPDPETWKLVAHGLDEEAHKRGFEHFADAPFEQQRAVVDDFAEGRLAGGTWERLNVKRAWSVITRDLVSAFYSHPWAWNEIGFGGPAYPRGYARLGVGLSEEWEGEEAVHTDPVREVKELGLE
jgi:hypothetical protein